MADQGAYEYLGRLLAPKLVVDYTSLFGGEPSTVSNADLMKQWAGFLPGFDTTYHELSDLEVKVDGDSATATVDFTASHWLGKEEFWSVSGEYTFNLIRSADNWVITSIKVDAKVEEGRRDVLAIAPKYSEQNLAERNS